MKRRLAKLVVFLLAGAIVNVALAWGCVIWSHRAESKGSFADPAAAFWYGYWSENPAVQHLPKGPGRYIGISVALQTGRGLHQVGYAYSYVDSGLERPIGVTLEVRAGWPLASLKGRAIVGANIQWLRTGIIAIPWRKDQWIWSGRGWRDLPYHPIWPGFAINTVFYAGVLWLLFAAPFALRRRRRIKRGLCPKCAYDLRGNGSDSTACPECGSHVRTVTSHLSASMNATLISKAVATPIGKVIRQLTTR